MIVVCGADELVVACVHQVPDTLYFCCNSVNVCLRLNTCLESAVFDLLSVLVGTRAEIHVITDLTLEAGNSICHYYFVCVSEVRLS